MTRTTTALDADTRVYILENWVEPAVAEENCRLCDDPLAGAADPADIDQYEASRHHWYARAVVPCIRCRTENVIEVGQENF